MSVNKKVRKVGIVFIFILLFLTLGFSAPPAPGVKVDKIPKDGVHKLPDISHLKVKGAPLNEISKVIVGASGTKKIAVIFVYFADKNFDSGEISNYTTPSTGYLDRMAAFYSEVSYGNLTLTFDKLDNGGSGYQLAHDISYYGSNDEQNVVNGKLFVDAVSVAEITSGGYDALIVVHAGTGQESSGVDADIWSLFVDFKPANAGGFTEGITVPANEAGSLKPFGVLCHEFGHQLGLPDLYSTVSGGGSVVGEWDLMDYGPWVNNGDSPPHFSTWCKMQLGWVNPVSINKASDLNINYFEGNNPSTFKIPILGSSTEYFLVEYRKKFGADTNLPGEGVLIWHIDDTIGSIEQNNINVDSNHPRVKLKEADRDYDVGNNKGEAEDAYPVGYSIFTTPYSDSYSGIPSSITVFDFAGLGNNTMTAKLSMISATTNLVLKNTFNFPNPVKNSTNTTIRISFSRPFTTANLKLYNLSGELILDSALTNSKLNNQVSQTNNEWVYDYNWDLKNSAGNLVSSGLYFYVVTAEIEGERQVKTGKLAIIK